MTNIAKFALPNGEVAKLTPDEVSEALEFCRELKKIYELIDEVYRKNDSCVEETPMFNLLLGHEYYVRLEGLEEVEDWIGRLEKKSL